MISLSFYNITITLLFRINITAFTDTANQLSNPMESGLQSQRTGTPVLDYIGLQSLPIRI